MWSFHTVKVKDNSRRMFDLCMRRAQSIGRADYVRTDGRMDLAHTFRTDMLHFLISHIRMVPSTKKKSNTSICYSEHSLMRR